MKYLLITCGCAECGSPNPDDPLIEVDGLFDTIEEAKEESWLKDSNRWFDHPQGGVYAKSGQGDDWILPVPDDFPIPPPRQGET